MAQNSSFGSFLDFLLQPVPFLPDGSFIARTAVRNKRRAVRRPVRKRVEASSKAAGPGAITVAGVIQRGQQAAYSINGQDFEITPDTWIFGDVKYGLSATVQLVHVQGATYARKIITQ